jgi:hypothetical protein
LNFQLCAKLGRVRLYELFGETEIIARLVFVVGQDECIVAMRSFGNDVFERRCKHKVGALVVFLGAAVEHQIVSWAAIGPESVESLQENLSPVRLDGLHQRTAIDPFQPRKEVQRTRQ